MQARKNKYQRDKRGHIIEDKTGKDVDKGKGKTKVEEVTTRNKFNALEVEEVQNPPLQITEGKGEDYSNGKKKEQVERKSKGVEEKAREFKEDKLNTNPTVNGIGTAELELKRVKKEAVERVLEMSTNPTPSRIHSSGDREATTIDSTDPKGQNLEEGINRESTIEWVHRRFGTSKEELRQLNVPTNHSCQEVPSQLYGDSGQNEEGNEVNSTKVSWGEEVESMEDQNDARKTKENKEEKSSNNDQKIAKQVDATVNPSNLQTRVDCNLSSMDSKLGKMIGGDAGAIKEAGNQGGSAQRLITKENTNETVNPSKTGEILAFVDGVPVYALEKELDHNVPAEDRKGIMCQEQQKLHGKVPDRNGTVTADCFATVTPDLGSVYALQFKLMQDNLGNMERNKEKQEAALTPYNSAEQDITTREIGELEAVPMACASGTGSPMQIQINVPLRTPNQILHDIITHKELPDDIQNNLID
ncbi:hypothetical protein A4A49_18465 [Nicotiana attenuata]|uniref:Uncharacterized protein n=1 Tax=Nicotiana attenuata TaxID=49451 RepID=A0A1J6IP89_NICAT|nr:hypothetical protein A4A49_18465 [Nicotiana attenuata]